MTDECCRQLANHMAEKLMLAVSEERRRCVRLVRDYLLFNSQRAVSWHEVQDVIKAIESGRVPEQREGR